MRFLKANRKMIDKRFTIIVTALVTCWIHVKGQSTSGNMHNKKCQDTSSEYRALMNKLQSMEEKVNRVENNLLYRRWDCLDIKLLDSDAGSGIYTITPNAGSSLQVYCDMTTDGGGWLVFQRRKDGSQNFFRNWTDYKEGFGKLDEEFWLGNDALHLLTNQRPYQLRIDLEDFQNGTAYAVYSSFSIDDAKDLYKLSLGSYSGTAGDSLSIHKDNPFSTFDADHDTWTSVNCATTFKGAWWYKNCHHSNLNGMYLEKVAPKEDGVIWRDFKGWKYSLKFTEMKIRPTK